LAQTVLSNIRHCFCKQAITDRTIGALQMEILGNLAGMTGKAAGQGGFSDSSLPATPGAFLRQLQGALEGAEFRAELPLALPRGTAECILPCDRALAAQQVQSLIAATPQAPVAPDLGLTGEISALLPGVADAPPDPAQDMVAPDPGPLAEMLLPPVTARAAGPEEGMPVPLAADATLATVPELIPAPEHVAQPSPMVVDDAHDESLVAEAEFQAMDAAPIAKPDANAVALEDAARFAPGTPAPLAPVPAAQGAETAEVPVGPQPPEAKSVSSAVPASNAPASAPASAPALAPASGPSNVLKNTPASALKNAPAPAGPRMAAAETPGPRVLAPRAKLAGDPPALPLQPPAANGGIAAPLSPAAMPVELPKIQAPLGDGASGSAAPLAAAATSANAAPPQILPSAPLATVPMHQPDWPEGLVSGPISALLDAAGGDMVLDITPEDLGRMTISLSVQGDMATVRILTETPEAARLLLEAERQLANELARFGMSLAGHEASADRHGPGPQAWAGRGAGSAGADLPDAAIPVPLNARLVNLIA
jgi:hypothetical protein